MISLLNYLWRLRNNYFCMNIEQSKNRWPVDCWVLWKEASFSELNHPTAVISWHTLWPPASFIFASTSLNSDDDIGNINFAQYLWFTPRHQVVVRYRILHFRVYSLVDISYLYSVSELTGTIWPNIVENISESVNLFSACYFLLMSPHANSRSWVFLCISILSSDADSFVKNLSCQCLKPWQGSQQEVPESHEAEPKEETENMKAVKDTISKREK